MEEQCREIEHRINDSLKLYKKVRDVAELHKPKTAGYLTDTQDNTVIDIVVTKTIQMKYVTTIFKTLERALLYTIQTVILDQ